MSTIGYARVSTVEQNEAAQVAALRAAGADEIYVDNASGKDTDRPEWKACTERLGAGDVLIVTRIDRLARSLIDLIETMGLLRVWLTVFLLVFRPRVIRLVS
ncbi:recombinase family protein [Trueperella pyogenes]|uniref:recombinase family protein n=1 Tax=Trueperella pyogenes TaxID=1661 RepID=UPI00345DEA84